MTTGAQVAEMCGGFALIAAMVVAIALSGRWTLRPLDLAARNSTRRPQFTLVDFFCLFLLIQLPTGLIHGWLPDYPAIWALDAFASGACGLAWSFSVRTLSRAGVQNPWHRGIFLVLVLPMAFFGATVASVLPLALFARVVEGRGDGWTIGLLAAVEAALCAGLYACGWFTRRIVAAARGPEGSPFAENRH